MHGGEYVLYNVVGGIMKKGKINKFSPIDVKDVAKNIYMLRLTAGQQTKIIKVIIK